MDNRPEEEALAAAAAAAGEGGMHTHPEEEALAAAAAGEGGMHTHPPVREHRQKADIGAHQGKGSPLHLHPFELGLASTEGPP